MIHHASTVDSPIATPPAFVLGVLSIGFAIAVVWAIAATEESARVRALLRTARMSLARMREGRRGWRS